MCILLNKNGIDSDVEYERGKSPNLDALLSDVEDSFTNLIHDVLEFIKMILVGLVKGVSYGHLVLVENTFISIR